MSPNATTQRKSKNGGMLKTCRGAGRFHPGAARRRSQRTSEAHANEAGVKVGAARERRQINSLALCRGLGKHFLSNTRWEHEVDHDAKKCSQFLVFCVLDDRCKHPCALAAF